MDWNLNPTDKRKMADRELDGLEQRLEQRPISRYLLKANAVNLSDALQKSNCFDGKSSGPGSNKITGAFKPANKPRDKWFDAK